MLKYRVRKDRFYVGATPKGRTFLCEDPKLACSFEDISVAAELASLWSDGFIEAFEDLGSSPEAFDETPNAAPEEILITSCLAGGTVTFTVDRVYKSPNDQHHHQRKNTNQSLLSVLNQQDLMTNLCLFKLI